MRAHLRALVLGGVAAGGVLASHWLGFRIAVPDHQHRGEVLQATGHQYFGYVIALVVGLLVAAVAAFVSQRVRSNRLEMTGASMFRYALLRLLPLGVAAFIGLEASERFLFTQHHATALFEQAPVLIGIALQALVAFIGALFIMLLSVVVDAFTSEPRTYGKPATGTAYFSIDRVLFSRSPLGGCGTRAPPALAL
jgi:hypothetical protein